MSRRKKDKPKHPPRVYGYARVSTAGQDVETQCRAIENYVRQNEVGDLLHTYCDEAVSGAKPFLERKRGRLLADVLQSGDVVVVHKLDRLGRSLIDMISTVNSFIQQGVQLHIVSLPVFGSMDMGTPMGRIVLAVLSIVADMERELITERTQEGRRIAAAQGQYIGGHPPAGYKVVQRKIDGKQVSMLEEDPVAQSHIKRMRELKRQRNWGAKLICHQLKREGIVNPRTGEPWGTKAIHNIINERTT